MPGPALALRLGSHTQTPAPHLPTHDPPSAPPLLQGLLTAHQGPGTPSGMVSWGLVAAGFRTWQRGVGCSLGGHSAGLGRGGLS